MNKTATKTVDSDSTSVDKAMLLLAAFRSSDRRDLGVSELARHTGMSKSTTHRLLAVLVRNGVVRKNGSRYALLDDGATSQPSTTRLSDELTPFLADLFLATRSTVHLAVLDATDVVFLNKIYGHRDLRMPSHTGFRAPAHCTGVGKILLAHQPDARDALQSMRLQAMSPYTILDHREIEGQLDLAAERGIARSNQETMLGLSCVAAPVRLNGEVVAAMSVSGVAQRFDVALVETALRQICAAASRQLTATWTRARRPVLEMQPADG
ncbi:IclR family transcriptional regulator [Aeromicrobium piscarium]|uniref:IclR family transcriptional regulator n=1 Tax=Aeromicrobium piscarium TaxID=2590901 RepID=A0A554S7J4_9ACTN|nr:IclR family transcriptional regulator [Aeromicrobium piscarium]TSD62311.1 IclR family transcriptional regulator [Aeromicrobium piscarium]